MAAKHRGLRLIGDIRTPMAVVDFLIALSIANSKLGWEPHPSTAVSIAYLCLRIAFAVWAGYLAVCRTRLGLWGAAAAGVMVYLAEQLVVIAWFAAIGDWADIGRVARVFAITCWVPMLLGAIGGVFGRSRASTNAAI